MPVDLRPLPAGIWLGVALLVGACIGLAGWTVHISHLRYADDAGYFVNQMQSAAIYHRHLYSQIEFPYGPLLFYPPILLYRLLAGWQISLQTCYFTVLVAHQVLGVALLSYLVNTLPMGRAWKLFALCCFAVFTIQPMLGLNYTLTRFAMPLATLVFSARRKKVGTTVVLLGLCEILNLSVSPEMGFAFGAGAVTYALLQMRLAGRAWAWALAAAPSGLAVFLLLAGKPYLRMLSLFAGGAFNFIVEPLPHILLLLVASVWLVPRMIAARWKGKREDAALLAACLVLSIALVPVALGRADPGQVFFNGLGIFLLSLVAVSRSPRWRQWAWGVCIALAMLAGIARVYVLFQIEIGQVVRRAGRLHRNSLPVRAVVAAVGHVSKGAVARFDSPQFATDPVFDGDALDALVGKDTVATPLEITPQAEDVLKLRGQYRPSFYSFLAAVLDKAAEERKISEFNKAKWAMLPTDTSYFQTETQASADEVMGIRLPYRMRRPPYVIGKEFAANLAHRWQPVGTVGEYTVYRNMRVEAGPPE